MPTETQKDETKTEETETPKAKPKVGSKVMQEDANAPHVPDWYRNNKDLAGRVTALAQEGWRFASAGEKEGYYVVSPEGEYLRGKSLAIIVDSLAEKQTVTKAQGGTIDFEALVNPNLDAATAEALGIS